VLVTCNVYCGDVEFELIVDNIAGEFDCLEHLNCCEIQIILYKFS